MVTRAASSAGYWIPAQGRDDGGGAERIGAGLAPENEEAN